MRFLKDFLFNLGLLALVGLILYLLFPTEMGYVLQLGWAVYGLLIPCGVAD